MDSRELFSGLSALYEEGRPSYADALVDALFRDSTLGLSPDAVIADIGAGTGKFSSMLLKRGCRVVCVEPNGDMRRTAVRLLGGFPRVSFSDGDAAHTGLPDHSADMVTAAQAFHWFDAEAFRRECLRILKPSGHVVLVWNMRDTGSPLNQDCYALFSRFCPRFHGFSGGMKRNDARIERFFGGSFRELVFDYPLSLDRDAFLKRSLSGSYSLKDGDEDFPAYLQELNRLFDRYASRRTHPIHDPQSHEQQKTDRLIIPNQSVAYIGRPL